MRSITKRLVTAAPMPPLAATVRPGDSISGISSSDDEDGEEEEAGEVFTGKLLVVAVMVREVNVKDANVAVAAAVREKDNVADAFFR
jgi:hypothetical protein